MAYGILNRKDSGPNKCPRCLRVGVDFMDLGFGLLACFECGSAFVRKEERKRGTVIVHDEALMKGNRAGAHNGDYGRVLFGKVLATLPAAPIFGELTPGETPPPPPFVTCAFCGVGFGDDDARRAHVSGAHKEVILAKEQTAISPTGILVKGFPCLVPGCGKVCKKKGALGSHMRSHK